MQLTLQIQPVEQEWKRRGHWGLRQNVSSDLEVATRWRRMDLGNVWESVHLAGCDVQETRLQKYLCSCRGWTSPGVEQCLEVMGKLWGALSIGVRWAGLPTVSRGWVAEEPEGSQGDQLEVVRAAGWYGQRREAETWANSVNEDGQEEVNSTEFGDWTWGSVDIGVSVSALVPGLGDYLHCWEGFLRPMWLSSWPRSHFYYFPVHRVTQTELTAQWFCFNEQRRVICN